MRRRSPGLGRRGEVLQSWKKFGVDEIQEVVAGYAFRIGGPGAPTKRNRDWRAIAGSQKFELLVLIVDDFQEEHPAKLRQSLRVAIDTGVLPHDVLNRFDGIADGHGLRGLLIKR